MGLWSIVRSNALNAKGFGARRRLKPVTGRRSARQLCAEPLEERCLLSYSITDLGALSGNGSSQPWAVNSSGQVVGGAQIFPGGNVHAFLYSDGGMIDLGTLGGSDSYAYALNASGQVVGTSTLPGGENHAFLYSNGQMIDLGTPGWAYGINVSGEIVGNTGAGHAFLYSDGVMSELPLVDAYAINDSGDVIGDIWVPSPQGGFYTHAALYSGGIVTDLGTLAGNQNSIAHAFNDVGQVVGGSLGDPLNDAFLYQDGQMIDLGTFDHQESNALGINNFGQVVGFSYAPRETPHPFLYEDGALTDLNTLLPDGSGWNLWDARGINDSRQIVGYGLHNGAGAHAYLLTPDSSSAAKSSSSFFVALEIVQTHSVVLDPRGAENPAGQLSYVHHTQVSTQPSLRTEDNRIVETSPIMAESQPHAANRHAMDTLFGEQADLLCD